MGESEHLSSPISNHTNMQRQLVLSLALCALMCVVHSLDSSNTAAKCHTWPCKPTHRSKICGFLYEHAHFRGSSYSVKGHGTRFVGRFNDKTSSIKVNNGWTMVVFEHGYYRGRRQTFGPGKYDMNSLKIGNDRISSVKCYTRSMPAQKKSSRSTKCGVLYEHANFRGRHYSIWHSTKFLRRFNDKTSSIIVNKGWIMYAYQHANYRGYQLVLYPGRYNMSSTRGVGNDNISSVRCRRR